MGPYTKTYNAGVMGETSGLKETISSLTKTRASGMEVWLENHMS